jgi:DNA-binding MarR family transcriptional regulator
MAETSTESHQSIILGLLKKAAGGRLKASDFKNKLKPFEKKGLEPVEADRMIAELIEMGLVKLTGAQDGSHPRRNGTYSLTPKGEQQQKPARPNLPPELLQYQESFILLQVFASEEKKLTRSELNARLKTVTATVDLEFDIKAAPETIDHHLTELVDKECLEVKWSGNGSSYTLKPERGLRELVSKEQHTQASFKMKGETLNALLKAARESDSDQPHEHLPQMETPPLAAPSPKSIGAEDIANFIEHLRADKYAGKGLIPIHEVRRLVAQRHGDHAAGHPSFDPVLLQLRSEGQIELIAISDNRNASQEQLDASIPGMNETIFYIVVE